MPITRSRLLTLLKANNFVKAGVAETLNVDEATIRRLCKKHKINTNLERSSDLASTKHVQYRSKHQSTQAQAQVGKFVVIPDLHADTVIWSYLDSVCRMIKDFKPQVIVQIGDLMDYECLLGMQKKKYPSFDGKDIASLEREFQACAKIITKINAATPKGCRKVFLKGNHEWRADDLIKKYPEFDSLFNIESRLDLKDWKTMPYLDPYKIGKLNLIHGEFYGQNPVKKHLATYHKNTGFGHTHAIGQETMQSPMREIPLWGAMFGCLCTLNADYMRNKSSRAEHGFGYGYWEEESGDFDCKISRIIHGNFWAEGKRYVSDEPRTTSDSA